MFFTSTQCANPLLQKYIMQVDGIHIFNNNLFYLASVDVVEELSEHFWFVVGVFKGERSMNRAVPPKLLSVILKTAASRKGK